MKEGLTYISERTGQIRYSDDVGNEQWIQQLSTYIPLEVIKRGQPVSIATDADLKDIAGDNNDLYEKLVNSSDTYIVLTDPSRHISSVGLSLEYNGDTAKIENDELVVPNKIHIIGSGLYIEDKNYLNNAFTDDDSIDSSEYEYWPEFFNDYKNSIGKRIYVKGEAKGELTLVQEDAYLAYNNVIVIGFVSDANVKDQTNEVEHGAIEVQIEGDDRGAVDATTFEAVTGEDFYIDDTTIVQVNGENVCGTKVFALGNEDDETFKFAFTFVESAEKTMPNGFIALQRLDGATSFISTNGNLTIDDILNVNNDTFSSEDRAFAQVAKYYSVASGEAIIFNKLNEPSNNIKVEYSSVASLDRLLNDAMVDIASAETTSLKDGQTHHITGLTSLSSEQGRFSYAANDIGGSYEIYISSNLTAYFQGLYVASRGAYYNKGYAVLADIRNKNRQNIIGIYESGKTGLIKKGTRAIFLKQGLHTDNSQPYEVGATYYLGSHGNIFKVPQEFFNSVILIGYAQAADKLIVDCGDSRQYNNGDLPVGYMKPSVKGEAEYGFWLMDGTTWHKVEDGKSLFERLKEWYSEGEISYNSSHNFGTSENPDYAEGFVIPEVGYQRHFDDDSNGYCPAQIKWLAEGVYKEMPRTPFVRRTLTLENSVDNGTRAVLPDVDITTLMIYGPDENRIQVPELETLDIKLFVDLNNSEANRNWVQIDPGFHITDNYKYYGYKWNIVKLLDSSKEHPFGQWALRAVYSGTEEYDTQDPDMNTLGISYQADPYAPPVSLVGYPAKVFVTKHDYYSRQFDVENLFKDYVKESVVDSSNKPWISNAVSGQAVRQDIKLKVDTDHLVVSDETNISGVAELYLQKLAIKAAGHTDEKTELDSFRITSDLRLAAPNDNYNGWVLDYYNGILGYYNKDESVSTSTLYNSIRNNGKALVPYEILKQHIDLDASVEGDKPHNLDNRGWDGNLNANALQGAHLGYAQYIFSQNAGVTLNAEDSGVNVDKNVTITVPYIQKYNNEYITRLGNVVKYYDFEKSILKSSFDYDAASKTTIKKDQASQDTLIFNNYITGTGSQFIENFNFNDGTISFYHNNIDDGDGATLRASAFEQLSSIKYKYVLSKFEGPNAVSGITSTYEEKDVSDDYTEILDEALQAIYEMPLATFKYNRDYKSDNDYFKRFFGIVVENVAATRDHFKNDDISNNTSIDNVEYSYTEDERKSAAEYMDLMLDNTESAFNTNNAIGILLKAAKETQERLLNLEVATYGKDAPTLPGTDEINNNYTENQKSTIAGLNRLVKALCREVFQDADPTNNNLQGAWSENSENYSRLDLLDKEINGELAKDDEGKENRISLKDVTTYPSDTSITQEKTVSRDKVVDKNNDNDFDNGQDFINKITYTDSDSDSSGSFDGINDAINRIVVKLNQLTENINGSDKIKNRPQKLDYIRQTLETIIKDIYYDDSVSDDTLENDSYKKTSLSRIDKLLQDLYNFDVDVGEYKLGVAEGTFNNKSLHGNKSELDADENTYDTFSSTSPETLNDIGLNAKITDLIIDLLVGNEKDLLRNDATSFNDKDVNDDGYKVTDDVKGSTYLASNYKFNNELHFNNETIIERLNVIEYALQLLTLKVTNNLDFTKIGFRQDSTPYSNITSIDDFFNYISGLTGITFEKNGFYATKRDSTVEAEQINIIQGYDNKKSSLDLYNIIYDAVKRIKNSEWNLTYNNAALGNDYENYTLTKNDYEALDTTKPTIERTYTVTSDIRALLKLLYGYDVSKEDDNDNKTGYNHFETANETNDNFTKSPSTSGVSVLDNLYRQLYNVPQIVGSNGINYTDILDNYTSSYKSAHYDPMNPRAIIAVGIEDSILGNGHRTKFIAQQSDNVITGAPLNRIDILENAVKAIYNYVGFGSKADNNYYSGVINLTANGTENVKSSLSNTTTGQNYLINSDYEISNVYKEFDLTNNHYTLTPIAVQAYFNSLDIASRLGKGGGDAFKITPNDPISITNTSNITEDEIIVKSSLKESSVSTVEDAINNLITNLKNIDQVIITNKVSYISDKDSILGRLNSIEDSIGTDNIEGSILYRLKTAEATIASVPILVGIVGTTSFDNADDKGNSKGNAVERILDLQNRVSSNESNISVLKKNTTLKDYSYNVEYNGDKVYYNPEIKVSNTDEEKSDNDIVSISILQTVVSGVVSQLQSEMTEAIQNNRKLATLIASMGCNDVNCDGDNIYFIKNDTTDPYVVYHSEEEITDDKYAYSDTADPVTFCGEEMINITFYNKSSNLVFKDVYVPYVEPEVESSFNTEDYMIKKDDQYYYFNNENSVYTAIVDVTDSGTITFKIVLISDDSALTNINVSSSMGQVTIDDDGTITVSGLTIDQNYLLKFTIGDNGTLLFNSIQQTDEDATIDDAGDTGFAAAVATVDPPNT